jgi:hypothetical protein
MLGRGGTPTPFVFSMFGISLPRRDTTTECQGLCYLLSTALNKISRSYTFSLKIGMSELLFSQVGAYRREGLVVDDFEKHVVVVLVLVKLGQRLGFWCISLER